MADPPRAETDRHHILPWSGQFATRSVRPGSSRSQIALGNAVTESFNSTREVELRRRHRFSTREQARSAVAGLVDEDDLPAAADSAPDIRCRTDRGRPQTAVTVPNTGVSTRASSSHTPITAHLADQLGDQHL